MSAMQPRRDGIQQRPTIVGATTDDQWPPTVKKTIYTAYTPLTECVFHFGLGCHQHLARSEVVDPAIKSAGLCYLSSVIRPVP
jgi:hypothetical protein